MDSQPVPCSSPLKRHRQEGRDLWHEETEERASSGARTEVHFTVDASQGEEGMNSVTKIDAAHDRADSSSGGVSPNYDGGADVDFSTSNNNTSLIGSNDGITSVTNVRVALSPLLNAVRGEGAEGEDDFEGDLMNMAKQPTNVYEPATVPYNITADHTIYKNLSVTTTTTTSASPSVNQNQHVVQLLSSTTTKVTPGAGGIKHANGRPSSSFLRRNSSAVAAAAARPPTTDGAITTLHSLAQLQQLFSQSSIVAAPSALPMVNRDWHTRKSNEMESSTSGGSNNNNKESSLLSLHAGETVMVLLHRGEEELRDKVNHYTRHLGMMRLFTLDLINLPPHEFDCPTAASVAAAAAGISCNGGGDVRVRSQGQVHAGSDDSDDGEEEEGDLIAPLPVRHPNGAAVAGAAASSSSFVPSSSAAAAVAGVMGSPMSGNLSSQLTRSTDHVTHRVREILRLGQQEATATSTETGARCEHLQFPALIVWRAAHGLREEYPPMPPLVLGSQPPASQQSNFRFCDIMAANGGPLVVKELTNCDQVHSIQLWQPVFSVEHLRRVVAATVRAHPGYVPGQSSRTVIYFGASWCPPCMRIVNALPQLMTDDVPQNVHCLVKADMDLAKPLYDLFKVEIIPVFMVFDNALLLNCDNDVLPPPPVATDALSFSMSQQQQQHPVNGALRDAFAKAELGRLQDSRRGMVAMFIQKHCKGLCFDEDF